MAAAAVLVIKAYPALRIGIQAEEEADIPQPPVRSRKLAAFPRISWPILPAARAAASRSTWATRSRLTSRLALLSRLIRLLELLAADSGWVCLTPMAQPFEMQAFTTAIMMASPATLPH